MKSKAITICKKEGNYPHVSLSSNKIYRAPWSMVRVTNEKENLATSCQTSQNDFCKSEESFQDHVNEMGQTSLSLNRCTDSMGGTSLPLNGCTDSMGQTFLSFNRCRDSMGETSLPLNGCTDSMGQTSLSFNRCTDSMGETSLPLNGCTDSLGQTSPSFNRCTNSMGETSLPMNGCTDSIGQTSPSFNRCTNSMGETSLPMNGCTDSIGQTSLSFNGCIDSMGQNFFSFNECTDSMGQTNLSFSGCSDSIVVTDSMLSSPSSDSETLFPYFDGSHYPHSQQFETVNREQLTWAPQADNSLFTLLQVPVMLDPYAYEACQTGFPNDELSVFDNSQNHFNLHDLAFPGTNLKDGGAEGNMVFPTLEETLGTAADYNFGGSYEGFQQIYDPLWFNNLLCQRTVPSTEELLVNSSQADSDRVDHIDQEIFAKNCLVLSDDEVDILPALVNQEMSKKKNVTLVLDLDETLIHSSLEQCDADFTFQMITHKECTVYVRKRPFLHEFLAKVSEMFEVIIFTASQRTYAAKLLDVLDPENKLFVRRMYRESCTWKDRRCIKDLTVLGIDLAKVFIIDNTPEVFRFQVNNGIPIKSWYNDPTDYALLALFPFLEKLVDVDDVRPIIAEAYGAKS